VNMERWTEVIQDWQDVIDVSGFGHVVARDAFVIKPPSS